MSEKHTARRQAWLVWVGVCVYVVFPGISDTGLEVSIEEGPLGLCGLIQPGFVLLTVAPFPIISTTHLVNL